MSHIVQTTLSRTNLVLLAFVLVAGGGALHAEGFAVRVPFVVWGVVMAVAGAYFAAFAVSTRRFVGLAVIAGVGGSLAQGCGSPPHRHYFVPAMFALAALVAYGLAQTVLGPLVRRVARTPSRALPSNSKPQ